MPLPMPLRKPHAKAELPANRAKLTSKIDWKTKTKDFNHNQSKTNLALTTMVKG